MTETPRQPGQQDHPEELKHRAREFFKKASEVAYTLNYDYAIELYLDGLNYWPDTVEEGHIPLREIALRRQAAGGKKVGLGDKSKYKKGLGKSWRDKMLKAEYLLSKDPGHDGHMADMLKAAMEGGFSNTTLWIANVLFDFNRQKEKPAFATYLVLRDAFASVDAFDRALLACQMALQIKKDPAVLESMRDLSVRNTMQQGKYDSETDFRDSIRDRESQEKLQQQENVIKSDKVREDAVTTARREYEQSPDEPGKINRLVSALVETEKPENEKEAVGILEKAYATHQQFRFKQRAGEIRIKQLTRKARQLKRQLADDTENESLKTDYQQALTELLQAETDHYRVCSENYPTDMKLKYEYGKRLYSAKQYDQAIPQFQDSRNDPRYRVPSMNAIGLCFFSMEWYPDAIETFEQALESIESDTDASAKEIRYNLGRAFEADGKTDEAITQFRKVAQLDFNYKDVKARVEALRKQQS